MASVGLGLYGVRTIPVVGRRRVRMGPLRLGRLAPGAARRIDARERRALLEVRARRR